MATWAKAAESGAAANTDYGDAYSQPASQPDRKTGPEVSKGKASFVPKLLRQMANA